MTLIARSFDRPTPRYIIVRRKAVAPRPSGRIAEPEADVRPRRGWAALWRAPIRSLSLSRILRGGRVSDPGRLPRYLLLSAVGAMAVWAPISAYIALAPERFTSQATLILPGAGSASSVNLSNIGQASSSAASPFGSSAISPTVTYQRLIGSGVVLDMAAEALDTDRPSLGSPRVKLTDQTALLAVQMVAATPEDAKRRTQAVLDAFFVQLDTLRQDEITARDAGARSAIETYETTVAGIRDRITRLQKEFGLVSAAQYDRIVARAGQLRTRRSALAAQLAAKRDRVAALTDALGITGKAAAATLRLHADPEFQAVSAEMASLAAEVAAANGRYGAKHPVLIDLRDAYHGALGRALGRAERLTGFPRTQILEQIDLSPNGQRATLLASLINAVSERDEIAAELDSVVADHRRAAAKVLALVDVAAELDDLERDFQVAEAVFASALARTDTSKTDIYASYPLVQVLETPSLPDRPSSPKVVLAIAAGLGATLMLFGALALAWLRRPIIDWLLAGGEKRSGEMA